MYLGRLRGHAHLLGAAPGYRAHVSVDDIVRRDYLLRRLGQIVHPGWHLEAEDSRRVEKALVMVLQTEYLAVVHALAFEHAARIMEPVGQHVEFRIAPRDEAAIVPDEAVSIVKRDHGHRIFLAPSNGRPVRRQHGQHICRLKLLYPEGRLTSVKVCGISQYV